MRRKAWLRAQAYTLPHGPRRQDPHACGYGLVSRHGRSRQDQLTADQRATFERGAIVVVEERFAGTNLCGAFHPETYVRRELAQDLTIVDDETDAARDAAQDYVLFRRDAV